MIFEPCGSDDILWKWGAVNITRFILEYGGGEESLIVALDLSTDRHWPDVFQDILELAIMDIMIVRLFSGKYFGQRDYVFVYMYKKKMVDTSEVNV